MKRATIPGRLTADPHRPGELDGWLGELAELGPPPRPVPIPSPPGAAALLSRLAVSGIDAAEIVATLPTPDGDPDAWWLLERCYHRLTRGLGTDRKFRRSNDGRGPLGRWPSPPTALGPAGRLLYPHLFLAAVPAIRALHDEWGIDPAISWATLQNYGRSVALHRSMHGATGLDSPSWLILIFRGGLFHVGRLQFGRGRNFWPAEDLAAGGTPFGVNDSVLDLHVPPTGPLTPAAVDESFAAARAFHARHFPDHDSPWGVCSSWLLDPRLAGHLPPGSNIIRFQRRFHLLPRHEPDNPSIIKFVFGRAATPDLDLDELPQRTTLQRAIVAHLRAGGTWHVHHGWCPL